MAFSAAASGYSPGSLAGRPTRMVGGVRKRDESPSQFRDRMDAGRSFQTAAQGPTRADNIAKARADGTFDAKRNAFNAANKGSFMDAAGNIGPKAEMPFAPTMAPQPTPTPLPSSPATSPVSTKPQGPATFDGKSKANFFGAAMAKNGPGMASVYLDPEVRKVAANGGKPLPKVDISTEDQQWAKAQKANRKGESSMVAAATTPGGYTGPMARPTGLTAAATRK